MLRKSAALPSPQEATSECQAMPAGRCGWQIWNSCNSCFFVAICNFDFIFISDWIMPSKIYPSIKSTGRKIGNSSHLEMASQFLSAIFLSAVQAFLPARCSKGRQRYPLPKRRLANAKRCLPDAVAGRFGTAVILLFLRCNRNFDFIFTSERKYPK